MKASLQDIKFFYVQQTDSTNLEIQRICLNQQSEALAPTQELVQQKLNSKSSSDKPPIVLRADFQSLGRGQRGSHWESERGKNLLFSIKFWPQEVKVKEQFLLSEAMSLAIVDRLNSLCPVFAIKWPNDIYYINKVEKISGTIIETQWRAAEVESCTMGVGININQAKFLSSAPNPTSLYKIFGREFKIEPLLEEIVANFIENLERISAGQKHQIQSRYAAQLIWREGMHPYCDKDGKFLARVVEVEPDGHLVLQDEQSHLRRYMFKEAKHLFDNIECE